MSFWELLSQLPYWFQMGFLSGLLIGFLFVLNELTNRKMRISKEGVMFDRLRDKKSLFLQLLEFRHKVKKNKIKIEDL
jgi:hypothetical protein